MYTEIDKFYLLNNLSGFTWSNDDKSIFFAFYNTEVWFNIPEKEIFHATYRVDLDQGKLKINLK